MKKKSLFDIAMEQKEKNTNNDNILNKQKNIKNSIIEIIGKIIKLIIYVIICIVLTVGSTVLLNNSLREQLVNIIKTNI